MKPLEIISRNPEETQKLGMRLGELAAAGDIYLLSGNLGAGKTCLTQGIARGLGVTEHYISSPSFVLMREAHGRLPLYHIDLYRLNRIEEITDLGLDDYLYGNGVCVIEWAERGTGVLPLEHLQITINYVSDTERKLFFQPAGQRFEQLVADLKKKL